MEYLIDNNIKDKGEFQLTNALENMKNKGIKFVPGKVDEWLDCGNKNATVYTNQRVLEFNKSSKMIADSAQKINSLIIEPCFIGENVKVINSIVGPHVSLGNNVKIENSIIKNSIVQTNTLISNANIENSMLGNYIEYKGSAEDLSIGDYTVITMQ